MRLLWILFLLTVLSQRAMQQPADVNEKEEELCVVPSLRLLAFREVGKNMHRIGWKVEQKSALIQDVINAEESCKDLFEKARIVDTFKLQEMFTPTAIEIANYIDSHVGANQRRHALAELEKLSTAMKRAVSEYRKK